MRNPVETDSYLILQECIRIAHDPNETPERQRLAGKWASKLINSTDGGWEGGGVTVAERYGVEVASDAPGGSKLSSPGGASRKIDHSGVDIEAGELSSELHSGQRTDYRARERY